MATIVVNSANNLDSGTSCGFARKRQPEQLERAAGQRDAGLPPGQRWAHRHASSPRGKHGHRQGHGHLGPQPRPAQRRSPAGRRRPWGPAARRRRVRGCCSRGGESGSRRGPQRRGRSRLGHDRIVHGGPGEPDDACTGGDRHGRGRHQPGVSDRHAYQPARRDCRVARSERLCRVHQRRRVQQRDRGARPERHELGRELPGLPAPRHLQQHLAESDHGQSQRDLRRPRRH